MVKHVLIDEIHLSVHVPATLPKKSTARVVRSLKSKKFQDQLRRVIGALFKRNSSLRMTRLTISR